MTDDPRSPASVAASLRRAFDRSFAEPEPVTRDVPERFLAITIADAAYAVRLREVAALAAVRGIAVLPGARPEQLGVAAHRGTLVAVFDLGALLGHAPCADPRWLLLCGTGEAIGLAIARLDGQLEGASDVRPVGAAASAHRHVDGIVAGTPTRSIIDIASIIDTITRREP